MNLPTPLSRRAFLDFSATGLTAAALACLLGRESRAAAGTALPAAHHAPKAKRAIHIFLVGGLSQVDSFDYKPELEALHGKALPDSSKVSTFSGAVGLLRRSDWSFRQRGQSGLWVSDLFPHLATVADELTVVRSMVADTSNHMPAMFQANSGFQSNGYPSLGSWLSYGLGNESDALPTFVVLPDARSQPNGGASNWSSGFLPATHQGVLFQSATEPIRDLFPAQPTAADAEREGLGLLARINQSHLAGHPGDGLLTARVRAYELAARMQTSIPEATDFADEPAFITRSYGLDRPETADCGRRCLLARRLLERGTRFVQIYSGGAFGGKPRHGWDGHEDNRENHQREAPMIDQPIAALIKDLKQRGMLEDTLLIFTTEFGRTPFAQSAAGVIGAGRDHNPQGFSVWLAGAGLKGGTAFGETDDFGLRSVQDAVTWPDLHATVLHLLGLDHERLTYYHNGIQRRLTNVHGHLVKGILA
ncbi:MAG: DUF1501 domain-containing protein [Chthoniobacter sp.]|nr:DUF1501 domain-containing protein [Chthoniobacter sp.]